MNCNVCYLNPGFIWFIFLRSQGLILCKGFPFTCSNHQGVLGFTCCLDFLMRFTTKQTSQAFFSGVLLWWSIWCSSRFSFKKNNSNGRWHPWCKEPTGCFNGECDAPCRKGKAEDKTVVIEEWIDFLGVEVTTCPRWRIVLPLHKIFGLNMEACKNYWQKIVEDANHHDEMPDELQ